MSKDNSVHHTTMIHQGDSSTTQIVGGDIVQSKVSAGTQEKTPVWAIVLTSTCVVAAIVLIVIATIGMVDWQTVVVPLVVAFLGAVGSIARLARS